MPEQQVPRPWGLWCARNIEDKDVFGGERDQGENQRLVGQGTAMGTVWL